MSPPYKISSAKFQDMAEIDINLFRNNLRARIGAKSIPVGNRGCIMWLGCASGARMPKYGKMSIKFPDQPTSKQYYVHRVAYMIAHNSYDIPAVLHVSHLCHFSLCINPAHLSLEPQLVNNQRQKCGDLCSTHKMGDIQFPNCILW